MFRCLLIWAIVARAHNELAETSQVPKIKCGLISYSRRQQSAAAAWGGVGGRRQLRCCYSVRMRNLWQASQAEDISMLQPQGSSCAARMATVATISCSSAFILHSLKVNPAACGSCHVWHKLAFCCQSRLPNETEVNATQIHRTHTHAHKHTYSTIWLLVSGLNIC